MKLSGINIKIKYDIFHLVRQNTYKLLKQYYIYNQLLQKSTKLMTESKSSLKKMIPEFNIGEIIKARDRLWRIDNINMEEKKINGYEKKCQELLPWL